MSNKKKKAVFTESENEVITKLMKADKRYIRRRMNAEIENEIDAENARKHSRFKNFVQLNRYDEIFDIVIDDMIAYPIAITILFLFIEKMNNYNEISMTRNDIAERLDISVKTVYRSIQYLNEKGYIDIIKEGRDNIYIINPSIAWASRGSNITFCRFPQRKELKKNKNKDKITTTRECINKVTVMYK